MERKLVVKIEGGTGVGKTALMHLFGCYLQNSGHKVTCRENVNPRTGKGIIEKPHPCALADLPEFMEVEIQTIQADV